MSSTSYRVMKFGGTSVGSPENLRRVTDLVARELADGPVAVVVSAMGHTTDHLIEGAQAAARGDVATAAQVADRIADLATTNGIVVLQLIDQAPGLHGERPPVAASVRALVDPLRQIFQGVSLLRELTPQTLDLILSFGERISATVLAQLLRARGIGAQMVDARDWTVTDASFGRGVVDWEATQAALDALAATWGAAVPVHTGFLGRTRDGRTTTLGRNGSDYTATLLARGLGAREVHVWTDVSGVMTADPRIVSDAYPLSALSYMEAVELANCGAKMFHPRTMLPLIESGIAMRIRNTMQPDAAGTRVDAVGALDADIPTSVSSLSGLALMDVEWRQVTQTGHVGERVLKALDGAEIPVTLAVQGTYGQSAALAIPRDRVQDARQAIADELALEMARGELNPIRVREPVTLVTLICETMGQQPNVAGRFFQALGAVGVNIRAIAQGGSLRSISCVIDEADSDVAVRTVHAAFNLAHQKVSLVVVGKGVVGSHLLDQVRDQQGVLAQQHMTDLRVVGIVDSARAAFHEDGLDLSDWRALVSAAPEGGADDLLARLARLPVPILADCTAADGMEGLYRRAIGAGIHVVTANKKPLTVDLEQSQGFAREVLASHRGFFYETTVGAALPVIETLKNLVRTGDRVLLVEGCLSGTLGYLTNEVMAGVPLSKAVRIAKELGYTEPQPQDDLSGMDVARKAIILARELGLAKGIQDVVLEPLVPAELLAETDVPRFFAALEAYDAAFRERIEALKAAGQTLRYMARVDPTAGAVTVGPVGVPADHPASHLRGSEAFVAFTTDRYRDYPLLVQGPGAGGAVTAAGVLADVLRASQSLRGR